MVTERVLTKKAEKLCDYEMVVVLSPEVIDDQLEAAVNNIVNFITTRGGTMTQLDRCGKRSLAYPIKHFASGTYLLMRFSLKPTGCKELENNLKISEQVLRHLLIKSEGVPVKKMPAPAA